MGNAAATAAAAAAGAAAAASAAAAAAAAVPPGYRRLSDADVWHAAVAACPGFLPAYAAYYHCRCRGWLIRSGLQYGADYVLYPRHPTAAHSTLCALVIPPSEGPGSASASAAAVRAGWPQWTELQALSRLCVQVNKGLILLHVVPALDDDATLVVPPHCKVVGQHARGAVPAARVAAATSERTWVVASTSAPSGRCHIVLSASSADPHSSPDRRGASADPSDAARCFRCAPPGG